VGLRVAVVGPCGSGKTTLVTALCELGLEARECVQEHSYVPSMWQRISRPDVLVFLDVSLPTVMRRKPRSDWTQAIFSEQRRRLAHARAHCDLYVSTDDLDAPEVLRQVITSLDRFQ
jgi:ABC-type glutathione transport system ATPase component